MICLFGMFVFIIVISCDDKQSLWADGQNDSDIENLVSNAQFDYKTKFQSFLSLHPFLDTPKWEEYEITTFNDTCVVIVVPIEKKEGDSLHYSSRLDIVKKGKDISYYLNMRPIIKRDSVAQEANNVILCRLVGTEAIFYNGYVENDAFKRSDTLFRTMPLTAVSRNLPESCNTELCHFDPIYDGGDLPGVTVSPDDGGGLSWDEFLNWLYWNTYDPWPEPDYPGYGGGISREEPEEDEEEEENMSSYPNIKRHFPKGSRLSDEQNEALERELNALLNDCIHGKIDAKITDMAPDTWKGEVYIEPTLLGNAAVSPDNDLKFAYPEAIAANNLAHEWIHFYQRANGIKVGDKNYTGMAEFELALFQDIIMYIKTNGDFYRPENGIITDPSWVEMSRTIPHQDKEDYKKWIESLCRNNTLPTSIDHNEFLEWSKCFGKYANGYSLYGYTYGNENYGTSIINSLLSLVSECF